MVDVAHDGDDRGSRLEVLVGLGRQLGVEVDVEVLEELAVLLFGRDDLDDVAELGAEGLERALVERLRRGGHLPQVEEDGHERRGVDVDLLREVAERRAAAQPNRGLAVAARDLHAADRRGLLLLVFLALRALALAPAYGPASGTTERSRGASAASASAGRGSAAGGESGTAAGSATAPRRAASGGSARAGCSGGCRTGSPRGAAGGCAAVARGRRARGSGRLERVVAAGARAGARRGEGVVAAGARAGARRGVGRRHGRTLLGLGLGLLRGRSRLGGRGGGRFGLGGRRGGLFRLGRLLGRLVGRRRGGLLGRGLGGFFFRRRLLGRGERFADLTDDRGFERRGGTLDVLAHLDQFGDEVFARNAELFRDLVNAGLCHNSPVSVRPRQGRTISSERNSFRGTHRALMGVIPFFRRSMVGRPDPRRPGPPRVGVAPARRLAVGAPVPRIPRWGARRLPDPACSASGRSRRFRPSRPVARGPTEAPVPGIRCTFARDREGPTAVRPGREAGFSASPVYREVGRRGRSPSRSSVARRGSRAPRRNGCRCAIR